MGHERRGRVGGRLALGALGLIALGVAWEILGRLAVLGDSWPPVSAILRTLLDPERHRLFRGALVTTVGEAARGYAIGIVIAFGLGLVAVLLPVLRGGLDRLAALLNAVPVIALGPVLISTMPRAQVPVALAALAVFFTTFVATTAGFGAASALHHDVFSVLGAPRPARFRLLQLPASLPVLCTGLKLGAPAAVLGAILGEWFGTEHGIGPILVAAMQNYQIELLWATALLGAGLSMLAYGALSLLERAAEHRFR
jgi:ABC-type nitrate/sulfonate/bicarbonate transport system permease component